MNNPFKMTVAGVTLALAVSLSACDKNHDIIPVEKGAAREAFTIPGAPKIKKLTKIGKMNVYYDRDDKVSFVSDGHHAIKYSYPTVDQILVSHSYDNIQRWTTLIKLDQNNRCISSQSTDLSLTKKYVADEREMVYQYTNGKLTSVHPQVGGVPQPEGYTFVYDTGSWAESKGDLVQAKALDHNGQQITKTVIGYGTYFLGNVAYNCTIWENRNLLNLTTHLSDWGAEPFGDVIDFFLPVYGFISNHLVNYIYILDATNKPVETHYLLYDVGAQNVVNGIYTLNEKTTLLTYRSDEIVITPTPKPLK